MAQIFVNGVEGTLSASLSSGATTMNSAALADLPTVSSPDYVVLVIDPDEEEHPFEVVHVTAHSSGATTATIQRAQEGTSAQDWDLNRKVVAPLSKAAIDNIYSEIQQNAVGILANQTAFNSHAGSGGGAHATATTGTAGFMSASDKSKLNGIENNAKDDQTITAGGGLSGGGTGNVTLNHADTSGVSNVTTSGGTIIGSLTFDGYGHVTVRTTRTLSASDVGAAASSHTHDTRYYTETEVDGLVGSRVAKSNPEVSSTSMLSHTVYGRALYGDSATTRLEHDGNGIIAGDGSSNCSVQGVPYNAGSFEVRCVESGGYRRLYYYAIASSERFKDDIVHTPGAHQWQWILGLVQTDFTYKSDPTDEPHRYWIAEQLYEVAEAAGVDPEVYVTRDADGELVNIDQKAVLSDVVEAIKDHEARLNDLEARIAALGG